MRTVIQFIFIPALGLISYISRLLTYINPKQKFIQMKIGNISIPFIILQGEFPLIKTYEMNMSLVEVQHGKHFIAKVLFN